MAPCTLGGSLNIKMLSSYSKARKNIYNEVVTPYKITWSKIESSYGLTRIQTRNGPEHVAGFHRQSSRSHSLIIHCASSSGKSELDVYSDEKKSRRKHIIPGSPEVQALLTTICETTSIAEFKLNLAGFELYITRNLVEKNVVPPAPRPSLVQNNNSNQNAELIGYATTASLVISKPITSSDGIQRILDTAPDEGLVILQSPKVGFFRRSRTIKGTRAPPSCKEKQEVKEGQVLCYIEQLGGEIPIESDVSGEVVKILRRDGEPVGYNDALISILPSFPGIKKSQQ